MVFLGLIHNISLLVCLTLVHGQVTRRWATHTLTYRLLAGVLFGGVALVGMMTPLRVMPGIIFDGRTIVLSIAGLFAGPVPAVIAAAVAGSYRLYLGGAGALMGVATIAESTLIGIAMHCYYRRASARLSSTAVVAMGLAVHVVMLVCAVLLPGSALRPVLALIALPVLVLYPSATLLVGLMFLDQEARQAAEQALRRSEEHYRQLVEGADCIVLRLAPDGTVTFLNDFGQRFVGLAAAQELAPRLVAAAGQQSGAPGGRAVVETETQGADGHGIWTAWTSCYLGDGGRATNEVLSIGLDITARRRAEEALRQSEARFRQLFTDCAAVQLLIDPGSGRIVDANTAAAAFYGYSTDELRGMAVARINTMGDALIAEAMSQARVRQVGRFEFTHRLASGELRAVEVYSGPIRMGESDLLFSIVHDITAQRQLEEQLRQAQKIESVGRLAGGVAHDFNNMLQAILGHVELAIQAVDPNDPIREDLIEVRRAADRSADLTRQLLAFARKQLVVPRVLDLNDTVSGMQRMLTRLIGEHYQLLWQPGHDLWRIKADPSQLDHILANLVVNARDAMADTGTITVDTANVVVDQSYCAQHSDARPGEHVRLRVIDTGCGMDEGTIRHLFEPFFTTKELGKGTGLGLATVYGIVQQNHGWITVESAPGAGTTMAVYLPRCLEEQPAEAIDIAPPPTATGSGRVVMVEDEPAILKLGRTVLERLGYEVVAFDSPAEAAKWAESEGASIDLLVTDVVMPGMDGRHLHERLSAARPGLPCIFVSGYSADLIGEDTLTSDRTHFVAKPYRPAALAGLVHQLLGGQTDP